METGAFVAARKRLQGSAAPAHASATGWKLSEADAVKAAKLAGVMTPLGKLVSKYR
jgi:hypothetical protein